MRQEHRVCKIHVWRHDQAYIGPTGLARSDSAGPEYVRRRFVERYRELRSKARKIREEHAKQGTPYGRMQCDPCFSGTRRKHDASGAVVRSFLRRFQPLNPHHNTPTPPNGHTRKGKRTEDQIKALS